MPNHHHHHHHHHRHQLCIPLMHGIRLITTTTYIYTYQILPMSCAWYIHHLHAQRNFNHCPSISLPGVQNTCPEQSRAAQCRRTEEIECPKCPIPRIRWSDPTLNQLLLKRVHDSRDCHECESEPPTFPPTFPASWQPEPACASSDTDTDTYIVRTYIPGFRPASFRKCKSVRDAHHGEGIAIIYIYIYTGTYMHACSDGWK